MFRLSATTMLIIAVALLLAGVILPFLMVIKSIPSTFFLNFLAYACSLVGTVLGFLGLFSIVKVRRDRIRQERGE